MARPVNANAEATRARILDAARTLFAERGPSAVGLREVASEAGVGLATVTHYFPSKLELETAVMDHVMARIASLRDTLLPLLEGVTDLRDAFTRMIPEAHRFVRRHLPEVRMLMRIVVDEGTIHPRTMQESLPALLDQGGALLAGLAGIPERHARLLALSLNHLVIRYGLTPLPELAVVVGMPRGRTSQSAAVNAIDMHLIELAMAMLNHAKTLAPPSDDEG